MSTPDIADTGDVVDPTAPDPTPDEVTTSTHPDFVAPDPHATPINAEATP